jgi:hypothetical protein
MSDDSQVTLGLVAREHPAADMLVTWPKGRPLRSYLDELQIAERTGAVINYRIAQRAKRFERGVTRIYRVHDGMVRGWTLLLDVHYYEDGQVHRVRSDPRSGFWPAGWYLVCEPIFHEVQPYPTSGFLGFKYIDRPT